MWKICLKNLLNDANGAVLGYLLLTLNKFYILFWYSNYWLWTTKCLLGCNIWREFIQDTCLFQFIIYQQIIVFDKNNSVGKFSLIERNCLAVLQKDFFVMLFSFSDGKHSFWAFCRSVTISYLCLWNKHLFSSPLFLRQRFYNLVVIIIGLEISALMKDLWWARSYCCLWCACLFKTLQHTGKHLHDFYTSLMFSLNFRNQIYQSFVIERFITMISNNNWFRKINFQSLLLLSYEIRWSCFYCTYFKKTYDMFPAGIYFFKVNSENTRTVSKICSKLAIKTPERRLWLNAGCVV